MQHRRAAHGPDICSMWLRCQDSAEKMIYAHRLNEIYTPLSSMYYNCGVPLSRGHCTYVRTCGRKRGRASRRNSREESDNPIRNLYVDKKCVKGASENWGRETICFIFGLVPLSLRNTWVRARSTGGRSTATLTLGGCACALRYAVLRQQRRRRPRIICGRRRRRRRRSHKHLKVSYPSRKCEL